MAIHEHPEIGTILWCDYSQGFCEPEMVKRRPVIVISPKIAARPKLCTVVPLSTTAPHVVMPYHSVLTLNLPKPLKPGEVWIKGDMVNSVGFHRLDFIRTGKDSSGKRTYYYTRLSDTEIKTIRECVLRALGLGTLTKHL